MRGDPASALIFHPVLVVVGGCRVEFPAVFVAASFLLSDFQLFVIGVRDAHRRRVLFRIVLLRCRLTAATVSSPCDSAISHFASMSPPESDGSTPLFSRRRSDNFCDPVVMSGMAGSMRSSMPSRFLSFRSFSSQSMSFSVLSIFQTPL